jgi:hypothetical protein
MQIRKAPEPSGLDLAIAEVLREMQGFTADADEYAKMVDQLTKLYAMKTTDCPNRLSKDTLAIVIGNVLGIVVIVGFERTNILTSKAIHLLFRLR